jgi:hypothetical protein
MRTPPNSVLRRRKAAFQATPTPTIDQEALAGAQSASRNRKLSMNDKLAVFYFARQGVPARVIARTFDVNPNAVYYIANWERTAAHYQAEQAYERFGPERILKEIVTPAQIASINEGLRLINEGKFNDSGPGGNHGARSGARRAGATAALSEAAGDQESGNDPGA